MHNLSRQRRGGRWCDEEEGEEVSQVTSATLTFRELPTLMALIKVPTSAVEENGGGRVFSLFRRFITEII